MTPEPYPLTYASWKAERAKLHLETLNKAILRHTFPPDGELKPYTISAHDEPEKDAVCYRVQINHPHVYIFLIASDALQNLRSALDHAVCSLVKLKHPSTDRTQFPIWKDRPTDRRGEAKFMACLEGLNDSAIDYIKELQPYNRPDEFPLNSVLLWQLNELNRIEKHRKILVRESIPVPYHALGDGRIEFGRFQQIPTDYGCEIRRFGPDKNLEPKIAPFIVFGEETSGITVTIDDLWEIYKFVRHTVLPTLAGHAQGPS